MTVDPTLVISIDHLGPIPVPGATGPLVFHGSDGTGGIGIRRFREPAYDPEPDAYVTWDYCRGYADASLNEATSDYDGFR